MLRRIALHSAVILAILLQSAGAQNARTGISDAEIRNTLAERVDKYRQTVGIVVGIIEPRGRRVIAYGNRASSDTRPVDGDTVFEIGSITKVFTSLLLADMVQRKELGLLDPVSKFLPPGTTVPELDGEEITLHDLATHTSGLPRMPLNVDSADPLNPYADYSVGKLYDFLGKYQLQRAVGARFEYSNLGEALLGQALALHAGTNYESLVQARILVPLGMKNTGVSLTPTMKQRLASGHAYALETTPNWDMASLDPAGGLRSTANDLLSFLSGHLGFIQTSLAPAMKAMTEVRRTVSGRSVALGWFIEKRVGVDVIYHSGGTGGYLSFIGYAPSTRTGVVVLSNSGLGAGIDDIGFHLLSAGSPLLEEKDLTPAKARKEISLDVSLLERYAGRYEFPSGQSATISSVGGHLHLQGVGDAKIVFYPESEKSFFAKLIDAQMTFLTNAQGRVTGLNYSRSGENLTVRRMD
jgi:D-alanyl-D-alanine-carboxypeptidase/D-alanyl-D-alanine-endopeptidase